MTNHADAISSAGPVTPAPSIIVSKAKGRRRLFIDRLASRLVTLGGVIIIASILAILLVIVAEVYPLFKKPTVTAERTITAEVDSAPMALGVDEYREVAFLVTASGVQFVSAVDGRPVTTVQLPELHDARVVGTSALGRGPLALGLSDGRVIPAEVRFIISYPEGQRRVEAEFITSRPLLADPGGGPIRQLAYVTPPSGPMLAATIAPQELMLITIKERKALIGPSTQQESRQRLSLPITGEITALVLDGRGEDLFVGTSSGQLARVDVRDVNAPKVVEVIQATGRAAVGVSVIGFLIGDRTLIVGDTAGGVTSWQLLRDAHGTFRLRRIYNFTPHATAVAAFVPSQRDKGFITADASGTTHLHYGTTGATLLTVTADGTEVRGVAFAPKGDGFLAADAAGRVSEWRLRNPHPEITLGSLFGKVWYEGYDQPEYVWQSTGGTDDFEAKFSLTPLIFGTLKGTFYAMLFAGPMALLSALYASQFMHPTLKGVVKPVVEIMAALPSVVLGFIAGLWLAPMVERVVPGLLLIPIVIPALILCTLLLWRMLPTRGRLWLKPGGEVFFLVPVALLGGWLAISLGGLFESVVFGGDYRSWLLRVLGLTYDQRNSLVVGFAMGFAVIPIIFTIAEDSLSNVPQHLRAGSLALGATSWQTAIRVILPTASPGIFSAIMIGFGRAVGETMIVLMATGNTPVLDWSIFNGFRALSANIAVELPEAPEGGTLFRVLFLAAFLLFVMTFMVNTVAELVRLRLRRKYRYL
jgi:phosphate transport system permease protein